MKKIDVINLIKYHTQQNESGFREQSYALAKEFDAMGDYQLAEYVMSLFSNTNTFVPQGSDLESHYFKKIAFNNEPLPLPLAIQDDILGIIRTVERKLDVHTFLFQGAPGTGKTESAKQIARLLDRDLYAMDFDTLLDARLGQSAKNISDAFEEINSLPNPERLIILFDEIDAIALDRVNSNDLREMGRATSAVLKGLDSLHTDVMLIATTNLYSQFDKALSRRFDFTVDFNRYTRSDLVSVAKDLLEYYLTKFKIKKRNMRLFEKVISLMDPLPYPGEMKNLIKTSVAFCNPEADDDYIVRLYKAITKKEMTMKELQDRSFTLREIETLTGVPKSSVERKLKENADA